MNLLARLLLISALIAASGGAAFADTVRLDYAARGAGCFDAGRFSDEVAARLGTQPFDDTALSVVRVRIEPDANGFAGTVEIQGAAPRQFHDGQCGALSETIASTLATRLDATRVAATSGAMAASQPAINDTATPVDAGRPELGNSWLSGGVSFSQIWRTTSASGFRASVGYDRRLTAISLGARIGVAKHSDNFGSSALPYFGVRLFGWTDLGRSAQLKLGGGAELWLNSESETGIRGEPVFLHLLVEVGPRIRIGDAWALDIPVELGVMPYFSPKVYSLQLGIQAVYSL
jgi:hypothetical protein